MPAAAPSPSPLRALSGTRDVGRAVVRVEQRMIVVSQFVDRTLH